MGCPKCGCRMVTRSKSTRTGLACCSCGSFINQESISSLSAVNWWIIGLVLAALLGAVGFFIASDELLPSSSIPEATTEE
jgi:hypothetical protein